MAHISEQDKKKIPNNGNEMDGARHVNGQCVECQSVLLFTSFCNQRLPAHPLATHIISIATLL